MRENWRHRTTLGLLMLAFTFLFPWSTSTWMWFETDGVTLTDQNVKVPFPWPVFWPLYNREICWSYVTLQAGAKAFATGAAVIRDVSHLAPERKQVLTLGLILLAFTLLIPWSTFATSSRNPESGWSAHVTCPWPFFADNRRQNIEWGYMALQSGVIAALTGAAVVRDRRSPES